MTEASGLVSKEFVQEILNNKSTVEEVVQTYLNWYGIQESSDVLINRLQGYLHDTWWSMLNSWLKSADKVLIVPYKSNIVDGVSVECGAIGEVHGFVRLFVDDPCYLWLVYHLETMHIVGLAISRDQIYVVAGLTGESDLYYSNSYDQSVTLQFISTYTEEYSGYLYAAVMVNGLAFGCPLMGDSYSSGF